VPQYVPDAARRVRELVAEWWADAQNRGDPARIALEALLMLLVLTVASWRGIDRLRRWRDGEEPPYWRRASSAAGVILLRALPVAGPTVFLYVMIASAQALPEHIDWLFFSSPSRLSSSSRSARLSPLRLHRARRNGG
jgi:hypothetical protein